MDDPDVSNRVSNPGPYRAKFWELTDSMPSSLRNLWHTASVAMGTGRAVELLQSTIEFLQSGESVVGTEEEDHPVQ